MTKEIKKALPVIIKNKVKGKEEMICCLKDDEGRFEGFAEVSRAKHIIAWFKKYRNKKPNIYRRMQVVHRERTVKGDKRQPVSAIV